MFVQERILHRHCQSRHARDAVTHNLFPFLADNLLSIRVLNLKQHDTNLIQDLNESPFSKLGQVLSSLSLDAELPVAEFVV